MCRLLQPTNFVLLTKILESMQLSGNTILITGGSSGIGLELSEQLIKRKNKVIVCGRSVPRLKAAKKRLTELEIHSCDISNVDQCEDLLEWVKTNHPELNVLINNAAIVNHIGFLETDYIVDMAEQEIATNFIAPIRLTHLLFPTIQRNSNPAIINITSGLIYVPRVDYPFYNATKAALHSFTQVLRKQTETSGVEIIEAIFPAVNTPWHKGNPPKIAISVNQAVDEMIQGLEKKKPEIRIAKVNLLYKISRLAPGFAFRKLNNLAKR